MVTVYVPAGVVTAVEIPSVDVKAGVREGGVKLAAAPWGRPEAERVTRSAKPSTPRIETVADRDSPWMAEPEAGVTETEKSGAGMAVTVSVKPCVWVMPPPVPVTVTAYVPGGVVTAVEMVSFEVKPGIPEGGAKLAVAPEGSPVADRPTVELKSSIARTKTVESVGWPCWTVADVGLKETAKSGVMGVTATRVTVLVCTKVFPFAVRSTGRGPICRARSSR
jgi:hypothetical protein